MCLTAGREATGGTQMENRRAQREDMRWNSVKRSSTDGLVTSLLSHAYITRVHNLFGGPIERSNPTTAEVNGIRDGYRAKNAASTYPKRKLNAPGVSCPGKCAERACNDV